MSRNEIVDRRTGRPHTSMFVRMLLRAAVLRRGRAASALIAMVVAAAVTTAMLNLYADVEAKLRREFRSYGANIVVVGKDGASLPPDALNKADATLVGQGVAVPFSYVVARTSDGQSVVVAGTDFARVHKLDSWWSVSAWPESNSQNPLPALVGKRAAAVLGASGKPFQLSFQGHSVQMMAVGTLTTGAAEDSRIFISEQAFEAWTGVRASTIEIGASGSNGEVMATMKRLEQALPQAEVRPVRQIMEAEGRVLGKTRAALLAAAALIILTAALCVLATLMGWVFDRRRDFAIMKALGASEGLLNGFFAAEASVLGLVGAVLGFVIGIGLAAWIGRVNFNAAVVPRFSVLPTVVAGSIGVALLSAALPIGLLRRVQPAIILRGE
ncbi:MAG TPA: ABC transporter permease [Terriglobales bacterium]|nr:ABC transporter permease [Terriglobales bacterium]